MADELPSCCPQTQPPTEDGPETDPAAKSLGDALKVSFRLLAAIMIALAVGFCFSGFKIIEPQQIGIKKVFGRVVGTAEQGLAYTWPFPVGEIEIVNTSERSVTVEDFWMHETPQDKTKKLTERYVEQAGLRPGWDGALLTGDRNLLHVKMVCKYAIQDAAGALACLRSVSDLPETVRAVLCEAAIAAAADRTADGIQRQQKAEFASQIRADSQKRLNALTSLDGRPYEAVRINTVIIGNNSTWPLRALPAYLDAQRAVSEREEVRNQAIADARKILNDAAGASHEMLVGNPEEFAGTEAPAAEKPAAGSDGLIGQYVRQTDPAKAVELLDKIENVLMSNATGGKASELISQARAYKTEVIQSAESRAKRFNDLLAEYRKAPEFMLERHWADVRDEILASPTVEKIYLSLGKQKTVYIINRPPEIAREIQRELLKLNKEETSGASER